jgi:hypothetical protein
MLEVPSSDRVGVRALLEVPLYSSSMGALWRLREATKKRRGAQGACIRPECLRVKPARPHTNLKRTARATSTAVHQSLDPDNTRRSLSKSNPTVTIYSTDKFCVNRTRTVTFPTRNTLTLRGLYSIQFDIFRKFKLPNPAPPPPPMNCTDRRKRKRIK